MLNQGVPPNAVLTQRGQGFSGGRGAGNVRIFGLREPVEGPVRVSECRAFGKTVNRRDDGGPAKDIALIEGKTNISPARAFHRVRPPKIRVPGTPSSRKTTFTKELRCYLTCTISVSPARGQDQIPGILVLPGCSSTWPGPNLHESGLAEMLHCYRFHLQFAGERGAGNVRIFGKREPVEGPVRVSECRAFGKAVNRWDDGGPAKDIALNEGKTNISPARAFHRVRPPKIRVPGTPSSRKTLTTLM